MILTGNIQVDSQYLGSPNDVFVDTLLPESATLAGFKKYAAAYHGTQSSCFTSVSLLSPASRGLRGRTWEA